jgi:RNA polymerase sigma factor (sigma-70 family)
VSPGFDQAAGFSALYDATHLDLFAFLLRRTPTAEDATDCLAETYLIAWEKRERIPAGDGARPWLFGVARNVMRRGCERSGRAAAATQALADELESVRAAQSAPAGGDQNLVAAALAALPAIDREIITMISWDGLTPREVATVLGISPNLVRVRAHRARTRLRSLLAEDEEPRAVEIICSQPRGGPSSTC